MRYINMKQRIWLCGHAFSEEDERWKEEEEEEEEEGGSSRSLNNTYKW